MFIRHSLPSNGYTKIDRHVFTLRSISNGACRLYGYLCGLRNGANFCDKYIMKAMDISQASLARYKRELSAADLILMEQIGPRVYVIYIGYTRMGASKVKESWVPEEDKNGG